MFSEDDATAGGFIIAVMMLFVIGLCFVIGLSF